MIDHEEVRRMQWAARRGMLELDLVLEPFVNTRYSDLSDLDRATFQRLMLCEDQELFSWLLQREEPEDKEFAAIIEQILKFARTAPADR
ncbi:MAG: succinate dehydrogenase assembly factor 2 [Halieaceae bacterium]|nr:succinate dehydrogenase assembly factor 2 [Halieaceae bacterium]MCP4468563.1 succinate dehydrogenase assembly factor 2 [Halieaceae bacterium]MCP4841376.1 succinate dehydrogenase assembly factor 2 [Halieaceae bacterium]